MMLIGLKIGFKTKTLGIKLNDQLPEVAVISERWLPPQVRHEMRSNFLK